MSDIESVPEPEGVNLAKDLPLPDKATRSNPDFALSNIINSAFDVILESHGRIAIRHPSLSAANPNLVEAVCRQKPELVKQFTQEALQRNYSRMELLRYMRTHLRKLLQDVPPK